MRRFRHVICFLLFLLLQNSCWIASDENEDRNDDESELNNDNVTDDIEDDNENSTSTTFFSRVDELRELLDVDVPENMNLGAMTSVVAASSIIDIVTRSLHERLTKMFEKVHTNECREKIGKHFGYFVNAIGKEHSLPFSDVTFPNECNEPVYDFRKMPEGVHIGEIQNRTYQPPRNESLYLDNPDDMVICYGILTHDNPRATIRLIESLDEDGLNNRHQFVVHVDAKEIYDESQNTLVEYALTKSNVHILDDRRRVHVNWGGFSMVNATLQILQFVFDMDVEDIDERQPMPFHKFIHISSSTYPIASNTEIRHKLASYPLDANFLYVIMQPTRASPYVWHYYVECDDAIHRIYQMPVLRDLVHGANSFTSSQWFIASYEFAEYLATAPHGSFVDQYLRYAEHVVVADENFFGTVLRHTQFCHKHHNQNFLHLQFDRWESELPESKRDGRKCPMPDPNHCGRSPTIMTLDYADIMELSENLFARKFDESIDKEVKEVVDFWRNSRLESIRNGTDPLKANKMKNFVFEGHGVLIVARETVNDTMPLCMALGETGNIIQLLPCFEDWIPKTFAEGWESGAVILSETMPHTRWEVGPCTSDGILERLPSGEINVTLGRYSNTGPRCMLKQMDGLRTGRCYDSGSTTFQPGGQSQVYPCTREWYQFLSIADGRIAPKGSMYGTIPSHIVNQIRNLGHQQIPYMCLGVLGRGNNDEKPWNETNETQEAIVEEVTWKPLSEWNGENIVSTQCSNTGAIIEWALVPFIVEEYEDKESITENDMPESVDEL